MAVRPGGRGDVTASHVVWSERRGAPYVCSPLLCGEFLYVHTDQGILTCYEADTGIVQYRRRLDAGFVASGVAGDGRIYLTSDKGSTLVLRAGPKFEELARNPLDEETLASPAVSDAALFIRTRRHLYRIENAGPEPPGPANLDGAGPTDH